MGFFELILLIDLWIGRQFRVIGRRLQLCSASGMNEVIECGVRFNHVFLGRVIG